MTPPERRPVASLWIGTRLHYLNILCLQSHLAHGHPVTLYCTDHVENVPNGVEVRPASEVLDIDLDLAEQTSASFVSNIFRYRMIAATGAIWIDCDAFCHLPFPDEADYIFAGHGFRGALNCGVVLIPRQGELIGRLLDYYENLPEAPAWFNKNQRRKLDKQPTDIPHALRIYRTERTAFGPQAFTYFARETGDDARAMSSDALYPVPFQLNDVFYDPHGHVEGHFTDQTLSVHLYTNGTRPWWRKHGPLPGSYVARMCALHGITPEDALG